jgi:hypothetical protein
MQINILSYGAAGDGITDCYTAFQTAENDLRDKFGSGEIYVPAGKYLVSKPFYHWSNITLTGEGQASIITNNTPGAKGSDANFCIQIGNFKPSSFAKCTHYKVKDIVAGQNFVKLLRTGDISQFVVGDCVLIHSTSGFKGHMGDFKPYHAYVNRIAYIDQAQRALYLEDVLADPIVGAKVANAKNSNPKDYICQFPVIQNIAFESNGDWTLRFGCYKGVFKNLWIKSTDVIGGNAISHCTFENITATFSQKVIEMATYSHDSTVTDLTATWYDGFADPEMKPLLVMGENVRNCTFKNINIDAGLMTNMGMIMRFDHAFGNKIIDSTFRAQKPQGGVVEFSTSSPDSIVTNNEVTNKELFVTGARAFVICDVDGTTATMTGNAITNNKFHGSVNRNEIGDTLSQNTITNNEYNI